MAKQSDTPVDHTTIPDQRVLALIMQGDMLFDRGNLMSLFQEMALQFMPERADFTITQNTGAEFADHLTTSYPLRVRRDLANVFSTMLRPRQTPWFTATIAGYDGLDTAGKDFLEFATLTQRNAMYDDVAMFAKATSQGDDDIVTFGQTVISCEMNWASNALLFRNWHLRDVAWCEKWDGSIGAVHRKWQPTALTMNKIFKGKVSDKVKKCLAKEPYKTFNVRHMVVPAEDYDPDSGSRHWKKPYISIFYDLDNKFVLEVKNIGNPYYIIPRWKTQAGTQYAYSPSTMSAVADSRMLQDMLLVMIEAGQKAVDPPMIGVEEAIRSDVQLFSGGFTAVDAAYDERLGEVLRPVTRDKSGFPAYNELMAATKQALNEAFFLNKVGLPPMGSGMSQLEVSQRVQEYVMNALPLFEPLEPEYNSKLCGIAWDVGMEAGLFGNPADIPGSLRGEEIRFQFTNPLREAADKLKGQMFLEVKSVIAQSVDLDPTVAHIVDAPVAVRDVIEGIGAPRKWFKSPEQMQKDAEATQQQMATQQLLTQMQQGANTAKAIGDAGQSIGAIPTQQPAGGP